MKRSYAESSLLFRRANFIPIDPMGAITTIIGVPKEVSITS